MVLFPKKVKIFKNLTDPIPKSIFTHRTTWSHSRSPRIKTFQHAPNVIINCNEQSEGIPIVV